MGPKEGLSMLQSESHVGRESMERFLRAELSREENQEIIRHLLTECPVCREMVHEAARRQGLKVLPPENESGEPLRSETRAS